MKFRFYLLLFAAFLMAGTLGTGTVNAQDDSDRSGEVEQEDDDELSSEEQKRLAAGAKVSKEDAKRIALERVAGTVIETEIEKENGIVVWEFEIRDGDGRVFEVQVSAEDGTIVEVEEETDDPDDDDPSG